MFIPGYLLPREEANKREAVQAFILNVQETAQKFKKMQNDVKRMGVLYNVARYKYIQ